MSYFGGFFARSQFYNRYGDDSDEEKDSNFSLRPSQSDQVNTRLERALDDNNEETEEQKKLRDEAKIQTELDTESDGVNVDQLIKSLQSHLCIECGDQPAVIFCENCQDQFCEVCFHAMHKKGRRSYHNMKPFNQTYSQAIKPDEIKEQIEAAKVRQQHNVQDATQNPSADASASSASHSSSSTS